MNVELILHPVNADVNIYFDNYLINLFDLQICFHGIILTFRKTVLFMAGKPDLQ